MIYEPAEDSELLASCISNLVKGRSFLDMGTGSGFLSEVALSSGALSVLAVDVQDEAVNFVRKKGINVLKSDLFAGVKGKFDIIACNPPYLPLDMNEDKISQVITTGGKHGDEFLLCFLKNIKDYLLPNGKVIFVLSSLTPQRRINKLLKKNGFKKEIIGVKKIFMETLQVWCVY